MGGRRRHAGWSAIAISLMAAVAACSSPPRSTLLSADDLHAMTSEMAADLQMGLFADRGPDSPPMRIAIHKVENLTSDIIPENQRWAIMARVRDAQPIIVLSREKNVRFVIPAEFLRESRQRADSEPEFAANRNPTHTMTATFRSLTRTAGRHRTDVYSCEFRMTELSSGAIVWVGMFEFKKAAVGKSYD